MRREQIMGDRQLAGRVTRWHTWPMIRKPSVIEHSGRVASLYYELWGDRARNSYPRSEVIYYCIHHDHGEFTAGDNPYSSKALVEGLRENLNVAEKIGLDRLGIRLPEITPEEFLRFKVCDLLEMFETGVVEWRMGNTYAGCVVVDCVTAALLTAEKVDLLIDTSGLRTACHDFVKEWVFNNGYKGAAAYDVL